MEWIQLFLKLLFFVLFGWLLGAYSRNEEKIYENQEALRRQREELEEQREELAAIRASNQGLWEKVNSLRISRLKAMGEHNRPG